MKRQMIELAPCESVYRSAASLEATDGSNKICGANCNQLDASSWALIYETYLRTFQEVYERVVTLARGLALNAIIFLFF